MFNHFFTVPRKKSHTKSNASIYFPQKATVPHLQQVVGHRGHDIHQFIVSTTQHPNFLQYVMVFSCFTVAPKDLQSLYFIFPIITSTRKHALHHLHATLCSTPCLIKLKFSLRLRLNITITLVWEKIRIANTA